jgi:disulfide bond formation protein DsbB
MPTAAKILLFASLGSLLFALIMQFGFGLQPCVLCLWQRGPYGAAVCLSLLAWLGVPYGRKSAYCLILCTLCFLIGMGLGVFHTGVELHWWTGTSGCAVQPLLGTSPDDIRESLLRTVAPRCDQIAWTVFGLSMANLNIAWSLMLAFFAAAAAAKNLK